MFQIFHSLHLNKLLETNKGKLHNINFLYDFTNFIGVDSLYLGMLYYKYFEIQTNFRRIHMSIKIITDSTCDIEMSLQKELGIDILPLTVHFGDEEFQDGIDITKKEFYQRLRTSANSPTTSQVTPEAFEQLFKRYTDEGHEVLVLTIASKLSGTYQSAHIAKTTVEHDSIYLVDSETTTMGLAWLVYEAVRMRDNGLDVNRMIESLESLKKKIIIYAMIENLEFLRKGGRLSSVSATLGTLLNLKPIIQVKDGVVSVVQKTRGNVKAFKWMLDKSQEDGIDLTQPVFFGHTDAPEQLERFITSSKDSLTTTSSKIIEIGITVGTHGGPGCIGIGFITK